MKILVDENVDNRIAIFLEEQGFSTATTFDEELASSEDPEILSYAEENGYAVLTHDDDFLSLVSDMDDHPVIIFLPQRIRFREMKNRLSETDFKDRDRSVLFP